MRISTGLLSALLRAQWVSPALPGRHARPIGGSCSGSHRRRRSRGWSSRWRRSIRAYARSRGRYSGRTDRAASQRRREDAVHAFAMQQRRDIHAPGHFRGKRRCRHRASHGAEPGRPRPAGSSGCGHTTRHHRQEEIAGAILIVILRSPDGSRNIRDLSNEATVRLKDELARLPGTADVTCIGCVDCGARVKLNAEKMAARNLTAGDVVAASRQQNVQAAAGQIGQPATPPGKGFQITITGPAPHRPRAARGDRAVRRRRRRCYPPQGRCRS